MKITIKDIAKKANVSITTVSRVLNNKTEGIGDETRRNVLKIIDEMGYQPNRIARSLITNKTNTIGLIIPDIRNPFFPELVRGVEDVANSKQYNVFLCNTDGNNEKEEEALKLMIEKNVDGLVLAHSYDKPNKSFRNLLTKHNIPVVLIDRGLNDERFSGVFIDNETAGYLATKHLIELNHRKIACITGPNHINNSHERLKGYLKAHFEENIPINKDFILTGDYQMEGGYKAGKKILESKNVTAIFALNDLMAFGVYQAAMELDINIPDDLSVVGFDNIKYNQLLHPKLTTIEQSVYEMGETATRFLFENIQEDQQLGKKTIFLEPKLIIRESTRKLF